MIAYVTRLSLSLNEGSGGEVVEGKFTDGENMLGKSFHPVKGTVNSKQLFTGLGLGMGFCLLPTLLINWGTKVCSRQGQGISGHRMMCGPSEVPGKR